MRRSTGVLPGVLAALVIVCGGAGEAHADGVIVVEEPPEVVREEVRRPHFPLEVRHHRVNVEIRDRVATTSIDQVFHNPTGSVLEGTYVFPLPEDASVDQFSLWIEGEEVQGEMLDRDSARDIYTDIVRRMRDPALLEYAGRGAFRARVFPIPARGERRVRISYTQVLSRDGDLIPYRYPLNTEKFSAAPLRECSVSVDLEAPTPVGAVYSPSHEIDMVRDGSRRARVSWEATDVRPTEDFVLYWSEPEDDLGLHAITYRDGGEGYVMLLLSPSGEVDEADVLPKDIVFCLDTSGSMAGEKMEQARAALRHCIERLRPEDRFGIVDFSTAGRTFRDRLVEASDENRDAALAYVEDMDARGGTNIEGALRRSLELTEASAERPSMVCFLTDGLPTIGVTDPESIESRVAEANREVGARLFTFGVGTDVNTHLLDRLAEANDGAREYVLPSEDIETRVSAFYDKVAYPVMTDLELEFRGIETHDVFPRELPDLFHGGQITVLGRYEGSGSHAMVLRGREGEEEREIVFEGSFDGDRQADFVPSLWARRKIGYLLDQIRLHGETDEVREEVVRLAKRYGVMTPYTSYLVLEDTPQITGGPVPPGQPRPEGDTLAGGMRRAAEEARGNRGSGGGRSDRGAATPAPDAEAESGAGAVEASEEFRRLREAQQAADEGDGAPVRRVENRTFYRAGDTWIESSYDEDAEPTEIEAYSEAYFELLSEAPELGPCLALGDRVIVEHDGTFYRIVP